MTRQILREEGVIGMFRGFVPTVWREMPGYFFFFGGYEFMRHFLTPKGSNKNDLGKFWTCDVLQKQGRPTHGLGKTGKIHFFLNPAFYVVLSFIFIVGGVRIKSLHVFPFYSNVTSLYTFSLIIIGYPHTFTLKIPCIFPVNTDIFPVLNINKRPSQTL